LGALRQRFGQVSVNFGEPIRLASFLDEHQPDWRQNTGGPDFRPEWLTGVTNRLGTEVARHINEAAAINPVNLVAMVMLSTSRLRSAERRVGKDCSSRRSRSDERR